MQKLEFQYVLANLTHKTRFFLCYTIGSTVTSIVKWVLCKIISVIPQIQAPFHQFNGTHAFSVSYFNAKYVVT